MWDPHATQSFASDNNAGIHPRVLAAIEEANRGHVLAYGDDPITVRAIGRLREHFGGDAEIFFVLTGGAANVLALDAIVEPHHAILCADTSHLAVDECGAPERFLGAKLIDVPAKDGKLTADDVVRWRRDVGDPHRVQLKAVSITQPTELGAVYSIDEIRTIADTAHRMGLLVHMDGARLANAAAHLDVPLRAITRDAGVDVLSFGGTKNGLFLGEAVVFFEPALAKDFVYRRKQAMQLLSKMRFVSAQFLALMTDDLWLENARHANRMAARLGEKVRQIPSVRLTREVQANFVFATLPATLLARLQEHQPFYVWTQEIGEVRWMTAFDTTAASVDAFAELIARTAEAR
jgi:threonine aldolase